MSRKSWTALASSLFALPAMSQSPAPISVYDGFWTGTWECSENLLPNSRVPKGFSAKVTFRVAGGTGEAANEYGSDINKFTLGIRPDGTVAVENLGHDKTNTTRAWTVKAQGVMHRGHLKATGKMTTADGATTIRALCQFELTNRETEARLDEHARREKLAAEEAAREQARRAEAAAAKPAVAEPAKPAPPAPKQVAAASESAAPTAKAPAPAKPVPAKPAASTVAPAPAPVASRDDSPVRVAAVANVATGSAPPASAAAPAAGTKGFTKVTANPVDQVNRKSANDVWISFNPAISVQERQFCRIVENYRAEYSAAAATKNQIKINETQRTFAQALVALLPDGRFQGWVMRSVSVAQAGDGSADILFELPCNVYVGSNACDVNPKNFTGTIAEGSRVYSELAKMTVNDFSLAGGQFVHNDDKAFDKNRTVASFTHMKTEAHCKAKSMAMNGDFFAIRLQNLSMIK